MTTFNVDGLLAILRECVTEYRKGPEVVERKAGSMSVTEVFAMPPVADAAPGRTMVDVHFFVAGVDVAKAQERRAALEAALATYPAPDRLAGGPSYIEVGAEVGDQGAALCLFALGEALGMWKVVTPERLGITGEVAGRMAGSGFVMMSGWRPNAGAKEA